MNKVIDSMLAHRSIRSYTDRTVSDEDLNSIIRACLLYTSPSPRD
mgnify:CR=1 FL=1